MFVSDLGHTNWAELSEVQVSSDVASPVSRSQNRGQAAVGPMPLLINA